MLLCKNVIVNGRRTSMRLEKEVWNALSESCKEQNISLNTLCSQIEKSKDTSPPSFIYIFLNLILGNTD